MRAVLTIAVNDIRLLLADKSSVFFTILFPFIVAVFFGTIFGGPQGDDSGGALHICVVDQDSSPTSAALLEQFAGAEDITHDLVGREEARDLVRRGQRLAYVLIPEGFGEARERMFWGESARLVVGIDPGRRAEAAMLRGVLTKYLFQSFVDQFASFSDMRERMVDARSAVADAGDIPPLTREALVALLSSAEALYDRLVEEESQEDGPEVGGPGGRLSLDSWELASIETEEVARHWEGPRSPYEVTFPQGIIWGMLICVATFGGSMVTERTRGTLMRLRVAPLSRAQILGGKASACFAAAVLESALLTIVGRLAFGVHVSSLPMLVLALLSGAWCVVGLMMLVASLAKTERAAHGIAWPVLMVLTMVGGGSIPLYFMPGWLQAASSVSPAKWLSLALEGSLWRGFSLSEMALPCAVLIGVGTVAFGIGLRAFRWVQESP
jgi:ABC-2 type transport system permease protein